MRRACLVVLLGLSACPPAPVLEGKLCTPLGACPEGLTCFHGRCRAEACDPDELGSSCTSGEGACARPGMFECVSGQQVCSGVPGAPGTELCNGVDDDCDGAVDDAVLDAGEACTGGLGVCAAPGVMVCADAGWACVAMGPLPSPESCNGLDDDCDGYVDDGCLSTVAGSGPPGDRDGRWDEAMFHRPFNVVADARGNVFVADSSNNKVKVIRPDGGVATIAGNGTCALVDGPASSASFCQPLGVELAPNGDLFVSDTRNKRIRVVRDPLGAAVVETRFADAGLVLSLPRGLHLMADGGLLVADPGLHRVFIATARAAYPIGSGTAGFGDGTSVTMQLSAPVDALQADDGAIIISENGTHRLRRLPPGSGAFSHVLAGGGTDASFGYAEGADAGARFFSPGQLLADFDAGRVLVADTGNNMLRAVPLDVTAKTSLLARGLGGPVGIGRLGPDELVFSEVTTHAVRRLTLLGDGGTVVSGMVSSIAAAPSRDGEALYARLDSPDRLVSWPRNGLVWADAFAVRLLMVDAGRVITVAGAGDAGPDGPLGNGGSIGRPTDVKPGPDGGLYLTDFDHHTVRVIDEELTRVDTFAGPGARVNASFNRPSLLAFARSPQGEDLLYVTDGTGALVQLRRFGVQSGSVALLAGLDSGVPLAGADALTAGSQGEVYLIDVDTFVRRFDLDGGVTPVFAIGRSSGVRGLVLDERGRMVWARARRVLRAELRVDAGAEVLFDSILYPDGTPIAGLAEGPPKTGLIWNGTSVVLDGERIFLTDEPNNRVRLVVMPH